MKSIEEIKKWLEDEMKELENDFGDKLFEPEYSEEHDAYILWDCYNGLLNLINN